MFLSSHGLELVALVELLEFTKFVSSHGLQVGLVELLWFTTCLCSHGLHLFGRVELLEFTVSGCSHGACAPMVHAFEHNLICISGTGGVRD